MNQVQKGRWSDAARKIERQLERTGLRRRPLRAFWAAGAVLGGYLAWESRFAMNPDGVSYLDIADLVVRDGWRHIVNPQWGPLYPLVVSLFLRLLRPSPAWVTTVVHFVNLVVFLATLTVFTRFLKRLTDSFSRAAGSPETEALPRRTAWYAFAYGVFAIASLDLISYRLVTPDLCVALAFVACADLVLAVQDEPTSVWPRVLLGVALGLGALAKAPMYPMALFLLVLLPLRLPWKPRTLALHLVTILSFLAVAGPWVVLLSRAEGHFTFSETGRLVYLWYVARVLNDTGMPTHWAASLPSGLVHPPKILFDHPRVLGFDGPIPGTYPYWLNPTYWLAGIDPPLDVKAELRNLADNLKYGYFKPYLQGFGVLFAGLLCGLWMWRRPDAPRAGELRRAASYVALPLLWSCVGFLMYAVVLVEQRYVGGFFLVFFVCAYAAVWLPLYRNPDRGGFVGPSLVLATVAVTLLLNLATIVPQPRALLDALRGRSFAGYEDLHAAEALARAGLQPGDKLASLGAAFQEYFAWVGRFRIVAEVPDGEVGAFWRSTRGRREELFERLRGEGIKAIVAGSIPQGEDSAWITLSGTGYHALVLDPAASSTEPSAPGEDRSAR